MIVESTQANLTDAIHRGSLDASAELQPEDLGSATSQVNGLEVGVCPNDGIDVGDGYKFQATFDETVLDLDDGDVKVKVRVDGNLYFNAGYNIGIGIDDINLAMLFRRCSSQPARVVPSAASLTRGRTQAPQEVSKSLAARGPRRS